MVLLENEFNLSTWIKRICSEISIPIISCGGAGSIYDFRKAVKVGASAVAAGSLFVYHGPYHAVLINYPTQQELRMVHDKKWTKKETIRFVQKL